jgi:hypothetical protein
MVSADASEGTAIKRPSKINRTGFIVSSHTMKASMVKVLNRTNVIAGTAGVAPGRYHQVANALGPTWAAIHNKWRFDSDRR